MVKDEFTVKADHDLHQWILEARRSGKRQGGKIISCTMAFELGARILSGMGADEETELLQKAEEIKAKKAAITYEEKLNEEQLKMVHASKAVKMTVAHDQNENIQKLAQRIIDVWDTIVFQKKYTILESLADIDRSKLSRPKLETVFPKKYTPKPSIDIAVKMATDLLNYEGEGIGA